MCTQISILHVVNHLVFTSGRGLWYLSPWIFDPEHTLLGMPWAFLSAKKKKILWALHNSLKTGQWACLWDYVKTEQTGLFWETSCFLALSPLYIRKRSIMKIKITPILNKHTKEPRNTIQKLITTINYSGGCNLSSFFLLPPCSLVIHLQNPVCQRFWSSVLHGTQNPLPGHADW